MPDDAPLPYLNRELCWLDFNARVLARGGGRAHAAARAAQVPVDLQLEPGRVLHGARGGAAPAASRPARRAEPPDPLPPGRPAAGDRRAGGASCSSARRRCLHDELLPALAAHRRAGSSAMNELDDRRAVAHRRATSRRRCSRCSRRWPSIRGIRSRTSPTCRSRWRWSCATRCTGADHFARVKVPQSRCRAGCRWGARTTSCRSRRSSARNLGALFPGMEVLRLVHLPHHALLRPRPRADGAARGPARDASSSRSSSGASARWCGSRCSAGCRTASAQLLLEELRRRASSRRWRRSPTRDVHAADELLELGDLMIARRRSTSRSCATRRSRRACRRGSATAARSST